MRQWISNVLTCFWLSLVVKTINSCSYSCCRDLQVMKERIEGICNWTIGLVVTVKGLFRPNKVKKWLINYFCTLKGTSNKIVFVLLIRSLKMLYFCPLQLLHILFCSWDYWIKSSILSAILDIHGYAETSQAGSRDTFIFKTNTSVQIKNWDIC